MKRFLKALPLLLAGGLALTACGNVDVELDVKSADTVDVTASVEASQEQMSAYLKSGGLSDETAQKQYSVGLFLESYVLNLRNPSQGAGTERPEAVSVVEHNTDSKQEATATVTGAQSSVLANSPLKGHVSYEDERYSFSATRPADAALGKGEGKATIPVTLTVTFPQSVSAASEGGTISGHSVTWKLDELKADSTLTAVTAGPGMAWWVSALLWVAGVAVTVLLVAITLMSSGGRREDKVAEPDEKPTV